MKAKAKSVKVSTRKVRLVADSIRNMTVADAMNALQMTKKHGSFVLLKSLKNAVANATVNDKVAADNLYIYRLEVNEGPFLKRFHASTRGRIHGYKKRTSHIRIVLKEKSSLAKVSEDKEAMNKSLKPIEKATEESVQQVQDKKGGEK